MKAVYAETDDFGQDLDVATIYRYLKLWPEPSLFGIEGMNIRALSKTALAQSQAEE